MIVASQYSSLNVSHTHASTRLDVHRPASDGMLLHAPPWHGLLHARAPEKRRP